MVKRFVRVYIEGGSTGGTADRDFCRSWRKFLRELDDLCRQNRFFRLEVVRCKGRSNTYERFKKYEKEHPEDLPVLLVDAEQFVPHHKRVWDAVYERPGDHWEKPSWATERHLYLMVPFAETWILTDKDALLSYFKQKIDTDHLPSSNLEERSKEELERVLKEAIRRKGGRPYKHGMANEIIEFVNPDCVRTLYHGKRLFDDMALLIKEKR